jgi:hypothetical protein
MGIPEWNKLGTAVADGTSLNNIMDVYGGRTVNINTRTVGTARYEERADTTVNVSDAVRYCFDNNLFDSWGIDPADIGTGEILEMCQRYFEEDWEIGEIYDTDYWDHEVSDETIEEVSFN